MDTDRFPDAFKTETNRRELSKTSRKDTISTGLFFHHPRISHPANTRAASGWEAINC